MQHVQYWYCRINPNKPKTQICLTRDQSGSSISRTCNFVYLNVFLWYSMAHVRSEHDNHIIHHVVQHTIWYKLCKIYSKDTKSLLTSYGKLNICSLLFKWLVDDNLIPVFPAAVPHTIHVRQQVATVRSYIGCVWIRVGYIDHLAQVREHRAVQLKT